MKDPASECPPLEVRRILRRMERINRPRKTKSKYPYAVRIPIRRTSESEHQMARMVSELVATYLFASVSETYTKG